MMQLMSISFLFFLRVENSWPHFFREVTLHFCASIQQTLLDHLYVPGAPTTRTYKTRSLSSGNSQLASMTGKCMRSHMCHVVCLHAVWQVVSGSKKEGPFYLGGRYQRKLQRSDVGEGSQKVERSLAPRPLEKCPGFKDSKD